jgi:hypothetical protein
MKYFVALLTLLSMVACGKKEASIDDRVRSVEAQAKYKCVEGVLYERMSGDIWLSKNTKCMVSP